ncbi:MAG: PLP-dependent aminotransferase family protein [Acidobacteria bacterium]|nr:PLP-dependent aminotransferase family protein [Acidobacteriota bacterium]
MPRRSQGLPLLHLPPVTTGPGAPPRSQQVYATLRTLVLSGRVPAGARLPSTRAVAAAIGVARNTVLQAIDRLVSDGLVDCRRGSGCRVVTTRSGPLSPRAATVAHPQARHARPRAFALGLPAIDDFPVDLWARLTRRRWRAATPTLLGYGSPGGYRPLREALAQHLRDTRAVRCSWEQVIIAPGARAALAITAKAVLAARDQVWMEDPGYTPAAQLLTSEGLRVRPVPVDHEGLDIRQGRRRWPRARGAYVTPSHQFPLGLTMSLARRVDLLEWAAGADRWVFEDDYDTEFRHAGPPLASLQGLDRHDRVLYIGTMSKRLLPAIRIAYAVVPHRVLDAVLQAQIASDRHAALIDQAVLADALTEGHLARHARRMRALYAERREALLHALTTSAGDVLSVLAPEAGLHVVAWLAPGIREAAAVDAAKAARLEVRGLSTYSHRRQPAGLVLGYGAASAAQLTEATHTLASLLRRLRKRR